jgi:hypothetical protein
MEIIILATSVFFSMSILTETLGVWARVQGAFDNQPTTGYSTHVRIATIGRFFILLSAPTLGYLVDKGINSNQIALIGCYTFILILISIFLFFKVGIKHFGKIYKFINRKSDICNIEIVLIKTFSLDKVFFFYVFISFAFTATGVIVVNYLATILPNMRAMIVQMSAVLTMFGTIIHVFLIDPKLSTAADNDKELLVRYTISFLYARAISSMLLILIFFSLYWIG